MQTRSTDNVVITSKRSANGLDTKVWSLIATGFVSLQVCRLCFAPGVQQGAKGDMCLQNNPWIAPHLKSNCGACRMNLQRHRWMMKSTMESIHGSNNNITLSSKSVSG